MSVPGSFESLLAKIIVTGADGALGIHTRRIETEFHHDPSVAPVEPLESTSPTTTSATTTRAIVVEVDGRRLEVVLPGDSFGPPTQLTGAGQPASAPLGIQEKGDQWTPAVSTRS